MPPSRLPTNSGHEAPNPITASLACRNGATVISDPNRGFERGSAGMPASLTAEVQFLYDRELQWDAHRSRPPAGSSWRDQRTASAMSRFIAASTVRKSGRRRCTVTWAGAKASRGRRDFKHWREAMKSRRSIHQRPAAVEKREVFGHWEGDLMHFRTQRGNLLTASETGVQAFFCGPHSSWQHGTIKTTNGIIRRDMPRKTDMTDYSTPRKCLGYKTLAEAFSENLTIALEV